MQVDVLQAVEKTEGMLNNIEIDVTIYDKEVEYGNAGMKIGAMMMGYRVVGAENIIVFVDLFASSDWWKNEDMLVQVFAHEAGHAIYKADQKVRYNFKGVLNTLNTQYAAETELEKYVKTYYDDWSRDEEMFAHMFEAWVTGMNTWGNVAIDSVVLKEVNGIEKWVK